MRRNFGIFIIIFGIIILIFIVYIIFFYRFDQTPIENFQVQKSLENLPGNNLNKSTEKIINTNESPVEEKKAPLLAPEKILIARIAMVFAERYGSNSSQSEASYLNSISLNMTAEMVRREQDKITLSRQKKEFLTYKGITTRALNYSFVEYEEGRSATILIRCQRKETEVKNQENTINENLLLTMIKINDQWKISDASWQENNEI